MPVSQYPVLYVDDEEENLITFRYAVEPRFPVLTASSGDQALNVLKNEKVAVLLSDQRMPGMSGIELCETARQMYPEVVRILITAYSDINATVDAINRGQVARYLAKPWRDDELLQVLETSTDFVRLQNTMRDMQLRLLRQGEPRGLGELRASIARQLRVPLSKIEISTDQVRDLLDAGLSSWDDRVRAHSVIDSARQAHGELDDPLAQLKLSAEKLSRREQLEIFQGEDRCDVARVVRAVCQILQASFVEVGELRSELRASPTIPMDPSELARVLTQLAENAADSIAASARAGRGLIEILVDESAAGVEIGVRDNGIGIRPGELARVFDPYVTSSPEKSGLGLAMVRERIRTHGGTVRAEACESGGAHVVLRFPNTAPS